MNRPDTRKSKVQEIAPQVWTELPRVVDERHIQHAAMGEIGANHLPVHVVAITEPVSVLTDPATLPKSVEILKRYFSLKQVACTRFVVIDEVPDPDGLPGEKIRRGFYHTVTTWVWIEVNDKGETLAVMQGLIGGDAVAPSGIAELRFPAAEAAR